MYSTRGSARANWAHFISSHPVQLVIDWRPDVVARFFDDAQWSRVVEDPSVARCRAEAAAAGGALALVYTQLPFPYVHLLSLLVEVACEG